MSEAMVKAVEVLTVLRWQDGSDLEELRARARSWSRPAVGKQAATLGARWKDWAEARESMRALLSELGLVAVDPKLVEDYQAYRYGWEDDREAAAVALADAVLAAMEKKG